MLPASAISDIQPIYETPVREKDEIVNGLTKSLEECQKENEYIPNKQRQRAVFENLPSNLLDVLNDNIEKARKEEAKYAAIQHRAEKPIDVEGITKGKVFEMLCEYDTQITRMTPFGHFFVEVMHDPAGFGAEELIGKRNPDVAVAETDEKGNVTIKWVGEAKLGLLDPRAYEQLRESGIRNTVKKTVGLLNDERARTSLRDIGVINEGQKIELAPNFGQVLLVPANIRTQNLSSFINVEKFYSEGKGKEYSQLLKVLRDETVIRNAAFSHNEVNIISRYLLEEIGQGVPIDAREESAPPTAQLSETPKVKEALQSLENPISLRFEVSEQTTEYLRKVMLERYNERGADGPGMTPILLETRAERDEVLSLSKEDILANWFTAEPIWKHISANQIRRMKRDLEQPEKKQALDDAKDLFDNTKKVKLEATDPTLLSVIKDLHLVTALELIQEENPEDKDKLIKELAALQMARGFYHDSLEMKK